MGCVTLFNFKGCRTCQSGTAWPLKHGGAQVGAPGAGTEKPGPGPVGNCLALQPATPPARTRGGLGPTHSPPT